MAVTIELPADHWRPRTYQKPLWRKLEDGCLRCVVGGHRRWGKDEVALHWTAVAAHLRVGTYWHMLPQASQARKAIWDAINPHTGKRRIDEAFPREIRSATRENEMFIKFKHGSTWQVVGSDNYNSLVGSPPVGVVMSEYALADPKAWAYLRPILEENGGWLLVISTPRGRNHFARMLELARQEDGWWGEAYPATQTGVFSDEQLASIRREMILENGEDDGIALFDQEYMVSFDAPLVGAYYARLVGQAEEQGRIRSKLPYEPGIPVETAWDLGYSDDTTIWWFQVVGTEVRVLDYYASHGQTVQHYCEVLQKRALDRGWQYGEASVSRHWVPWDAQPKTLASGGRSILELAWDQGVRLRVAPNLGVEDGIQALRSLFPRLYFDKDTCKDGIEALRNYSREWDADRKVFKRTPLHDWSSHAADAARIMAIAWRIRVPEPAKPEPRPLMVGDGNKVRLNDLWDEAPMRQSHRI